ncbi:MAG TPA: hypothetical protein VFU59_02905 [Candidatus Eisenbacteria bacterium]|nr:hypothetical protein [Candidatus Eisenbacteria bacterium]
MSRNQLSVYLRRSAGAATLFGALAIALAGCGDKSTNPVRAVPLTLVAQSSGVSTARYLAPAGSALQASSAATDTIPVTFTKALLVVRDVRFVLPEAIDDSDEQSDSLGATDSLGTGEDDDDVQGQVRFRGPFVIDLLSGHAANLDTMMVMPGDYARVQGHLQMLRAGDAAAADFPGLVGSTVWLEGTIDGEGGGPFSFLARIDNEFQIRGGFHVAAVTPATAFVTFDLSKWLSDGSGHFLDPRLLENELAIKKAIRHSIKVGMDDDHDGSADDDMHEVDGD